MIRLMRDIWVLVGRKVTVAIAQQRAWLLLSFVPAVCCSGWKAEWGGAEEHQDLSSKVQWRCEGRLGLGGSSELTTVKVLPGVTPSLL